eukprot:TRINITY_DN83208_c0_g1_i1.p1 TRINITY_DN83208_c0_g1~~TRINITY_DN83208_c0_g1_i1.p1  ORF type:complete len:449 (+),score=68.40 TRINITY_DN83208_c0_g1_i1:105-1451(+)
MLPLALRRASELPPSRSGGAGRRFLRGMAALAALAALPSRHVRSRSFATLWPDARFWLSRPHADSATVSRQRGESAVLAFDAYSTRAPGTKEVKIGSESFFAFVAPRLGVEHFVVWRREQDVREAVERGVKLEELGSVYPCRLTLARERPQLTAPVYSFAGTEVGEKDPNRYWQDGPDACRWMYWESFWAPAEDAANAFTSPAFGDAAGRMLSPLLDSPSALASPESELQRSFGLRDPNAVASTARSSAMKDRAFAVIYQFNVWGSDVSRSGTGSDLWSPEARLATTALDAVIDHFDVRSVLDCACGDANWIVPFFVARHPEVSYCGVDIVPEVINQNRERHPGVQFLALDLAESPLPRGAELVFSKETLNHMPLEDALNAIERFRATGAKYFLTNVHHNSENEDGRGKTCYTTYAKYDYELPPFNMDKVASIVEYQGIGTSFSLYRL